MTDLDAKRARLDALLHSYGELSLALSCSDENSFFLVYARRVLGDKVFALMADATIFAAHDKLHCQRIVRDVGTELYFIPTREMHGLDFLENNERRCYYCRRYILGALAKTARRFGAKTVAVALTTDTLDGRPGVAEGLSELDVVAPLAEAGFSTKDVVLLAAEVGIDLPYTGHCMAERIPRGMPLDGETLNFLAGAEAFLQEYGFMESRVGIIKPGEVRIVLPDAGATLDEVARSEISAFVRSRNFEIVQWAKL